MSVPKLRFKGYTEIWELIRLKDKAKFYSGGTPLTTKRAYFAGNIPFIRSGEINSKSTALFISELGLKNSSAKMVNQGDVLYALYGATSGEVAISKINGAINQAVLCIRSENNHYFLATYLKFNKDQIVQTYLQGGQGNLSADIVKNLVIPFPSLPEQEKIASFFKVIDQKLNLLKEKKEKLELYKKGVMQQIFSQKLRFKDEKGNEFPEWEEKKVKDIFTITRGNVLAMPLVSETKTDNNLYPVYSSQTKKNGLSGYYSKYLFEDCITWTTDGAGAGDVNFRDGKFYCTNVCGVLISDKGYANVFVSEILNSVSRKYVSYVGNPKLMNNVMAEIKISIPKSIIEQQKIADFLSALDTKINLVSTQIEKTELWKKGLLQQMFV